MKQQYEQMIAVHDGTLGLLRKHWMKVSAKDAVGWMEQINAALDERLRLMALRDAA